MVCCFNWLIPSCCAEAIPIVCKMYFFVCECFKPSLALDIDILLPLTRALPNFLPEGVGMNVFGVLELESI